jgi:hypothetical protein
MVLPCFIYAYVHMVGGVGEGGWGGGGGGWGAGGATS